MTEHADSDRTSTRVVHAVAATTGHDPLDLPPLYDVVDPDALDSLIPPGGGCSLSFRFAGTRVRVTESGAVDVSLIDGW